ncbi:envelope glycoprotein N [Gallid alphaherpesvirus 1]|nr:envelope glycoprotein N [Gallid alphaherpesvirus 1]ANN24974.1 envelope glycoprotein N [Gallid alphaherpesvirus 1]
MRLPWERSFMLLGAVVYLLHLALVFAQPGVTPGHGMEHGYYGLGAGNMLGVENSMYSANMEHFYHSACSSRGFSLVNGTAASVFFFISLAVALIGLLAVLYNGCFNSFKSSVISSRW